MSQLLAFELELLASCEYRSTYWYLDHLVTLRLQLFEHAQEAAAVQTAAANEAAAAAAAAGKKGKKGSKPQKKTVAPIQPHIMLELHMLQALRELSRGMTLLLSALGRLGLMPPHESEFNPLATRFERRFEPFQPLLRPTPLTWADYNHVMGSQARAVRTVGSQRRPQLAGSVQPVCSVQPARASPRRPRPRVQVDASPVGDVLKSAERFFKACKATLDKAIKHEAVTAATKAECTAQARVAVANTIFMASAGLAAMEPPPKEAAQAGEAEAAGAKQRRVEFSFASHKQFPVMSLRS